MFSYKAKGKNIDNDANAQLNWLHAQLQAAKAHHEKVFIAMHIPEGVDIYATLRTRLVRLFTLWKPQYVKRFDAEIKLFSPEISGIFMAHLHSNWLSILTFENNEIPQMVTTSVSPIFGNDPGFRLFSYSPALQLQSITNYFYLLKRKEWESTENTI
jgi:hypothetical protein